MRPFIYLSAATLIIISSSPMAECVYLEKAIQHARETLKNTPSSDIGSIPLLLSSQAGALDYARASNRKQKNKHVSLGVSYLEAAMASSISGDNEEKNILTQEALKHLEMADSCPINDSDN